MTANSSITTERNVLKAFLQKITEPSLEVSWFLALIWCLAHELQTCVSVEIKFGCGGWLSDSITPIINLWTVEC